jgi:arginine repressor
LKHCWASCLPINIPAHPEFDTDIKPAVIRKIWPEVQRAIEANDRRGLVQDSATRRLVRSVVNPCQLGQMGETHLLVEDHWRSRFAQSHARDGSGAITVAQLLRKWIDLPNPMGLPLELQNLIILSFAALTNRRFILRGGPIEPTIDSLADELELKEQTLPDAVHWEVAVKRAASLFGLTVPQTLNAGNVGRLVDDVRLAATGKREAVTKLVVATRDRANRYGASTTGRVRSAESAQALLATIQAASDADLVKSLANATIETSEAAVSRSMGQAQSVADALNVARWDIFDAVKDLTDHRQTAAASILQRLVEALGSEEHVIPLKSKLGGTWSATPFDLLTVAAPASRQLLRRLLVRTACRAPRPCPCHQPAAPTLPYTGSPVLLRCTRICRGGAERLTSTREAAASWF